MMIVGEAWGEEEDLRRRPFVGSGGNLARNHIADFDSHYLTNVFNLRPPRDKVEMLFGRRHEGITSLPPYGKGKYLKKNYLPEIERLHEEIAEIEPRVILAFGKTAAWALIGDAGIKTCRGYVTPYTLNPAIKVLPTWDPDTVRRNYGLRPVFMKDIIKAQREEKREGFPPNKGSVYIPENREQLDDYYIKLIYPYPLIAADIETQANTITEIGFSNSKAEALVIPFYSKEHTNYWRTREDEYFAWLLVRHIFDTKQIIGQNFSYDIKYLRNMGIHCPHYIHDTMLMHHSLEPELDKGLGFLASLYTNRPRWKFMRTASKQMKKGD